MLEPPEDTARVVRDGVERMFRDLSVRISRLGFARTKKTIWTRRLENSVHFVHLHRASISYGQPTDYTVRLRVHFGIRVLNDATTTPVLNGPSSDDQGFLQSRYHLRFNAKTGSTYDRCLADLTRLIEDEGWRWFSQFVNEESLITAKNSPLRSLEKERLAAALTGSADEACLAASLRLFGIKQGR